VARTSREHVAEQWDALVNVSPAELADWLETDESWAVGYKGYGEESVGHAAGRRIVVLLDTDRRDWLDDDWSLARKAVGVIRRHRAQWPEGDVSASRWRHALLNWGHDPLR
jgi:hypothetical protein